MASFGRRPAKGSQPQSTAGRSGGSDAFKRMMEEEKEREDISREHEEREENEKNPNKSKDATEEDSSHDKSKHSGPNPRVFFDIEIRGKLNAKVQSSGRLEFELFADAVPKTVENFRALCTGEKGRDLHYANCQFHSIVPGVCAKGGDITNGDGSGGKSIYEATFPDESFKLRHDARGILSMANTGPNTNTSQFQLTFDRAPQLDRKHVVFGKMVKDEKGILKKMEEAGSKSGLTKSMVSTVVCGEIGGKNRPAKLRSRSRSRSLPTRVAYRDGRIDYKAARPRKHRDQDR